VSLAAGKHCFFLIFFGHFLVSRQESDKKLTENIPLKASSLYKET
jgi:hypothetical protein